MRRAGLALVLFALAAALLVALPEADPARIAAASVHRLLGERVGPPPADGATDDRRSLADFVLDGPAVERPGEGRAVLRLYGVRFAAAPPASADLTIHEIARRSLVRGLRERAAARGESLDVQGELMPSAGGATGGASFLAVLDGRRLVLEYTHPAGVTATVERNDFSPPGPLSLAPPLLAILLAILLRRPVVALLAGILCAAVLLRVRTGSSAVLALAHALPDFASRMLWPQIADATNLKIVGFTVAMLAMVGVMSKSGGIRGTVELVARAARSARSTQAATYLVGLFVFFDDYASCILVGSTMRRATDALRISREKLAYLVDSTAAPVASLALFSSWIAYQVSTFAPQLPAARMSPSDGVAVFVETLPYRFYSLFTILLAGMVAVSARDFGPMLKAERRARSTGKLLRDGARPIVSLDASRLEPEAHVAPRAYRAIVPVLVFMLVTLVEVVRVGFAAISTEGRGVELGALFTSLSGWTSLLAQGDSNRAMLIGSCAGLAVSIALAIAAGLGRETARSAWLALKTTSASLAILYCAWMIAAASGDLGAADYLTERLGGELAPQVLPCLLFLIACGVSFSTGTSWGTMGMLLPLVVGLAFSLGERSPLGGHALMVISIAAVLEGAIFGDHCSPLSSTTLLTSISTASDLIDHVRTQLPYALAAFAVALGAGFFACTFLAWSPFLGLGLGAAALLGIVLVFGRKSGAAPAAPPC